MNNQSLQMERRKRHFIAQDSGRFEDFSRQVSQSTDASLWPLADAIERNILVYDGNTIRALAASIDTRMEVMAEWVEALSSGPGVIVIKNAVTDISAVDEATQIFESIIKEQQNSNAGSGDHFAKSGANDRIWNALQKHCYSSPENFARYYGNICVDLISRAWLGDGYQMTAQVNRVNPGGSAQKAHRDYHLGFMSAERMEKYPAHVHKLSPVLTLQGAIAHGDMPIETGPTQFLPYSQLFTDGYLAFSRPEFQSLFSRDHVQLPLNKGDAVFFNPAVMHAAGSNNSTNTYRLANLLQVSSAFGRAMENIDRADMCARIYPALMEATRQNTLSCDEIVCAIAACAEGYSFPTNLDNDPPLGGLAPMTQAQLLHKHLDEQTQPDAFAKALEQHTRKRQP